MALFEITVPRIGEGEHEVRLIGLLKDVGDWVERDEPLYEVETSKADMVLESPVTGRVAEWLVPVGEEVAIGAVIGRVDCLDGVPAEEPAASATARLVPPRTRAYARERGLADEQLAEVPAAGRHLLPEDIDRYLATTASEPPNGVIERPLDVRQQQFVAQLRQTAASAIPATMRHLFVWDAVRAVSSRRELHVSAFSVLAYCVAVATVEHPLFRSALIDDRLVREWPHVNLGVGVEIPPASLAVAVVPEADALAPIEFARQLRQQAKSLRRGEVSRTVAAHLLLSYLPQQSVLDGTPVLVSPAVATLFVGQPFEQQGRWLAHASLTFDHRLINGAPAARFLRAVADQVAAADQLDWRPPGA